MDPAANPPYNPTASSFLLLAKSARAAGRLNGPIFRLKASLVWQAAARIAITYFALQQRSRYSRAASRPRHHVRKASYRQRKPVSRRFFTIG
jgi:hypothetical protein